MLTNEQIREIYKCKNDPVYFVNTYVYITHPVRGIIAFKMFPIQEHVLRELRNKTFNITLKSRQMGISTLTAAYALWLALFHTDKNILIISISDRESTKFLDKVKTAFSNLPEFLRGTAIKNNEHTLIVESGSAINSIASSDNAGRSEALSLLIIDEAAFIKNIESIYTAAYPALSTGGQCIAISTPNGLGNWYHKTWVGAKSDENRFNAIYIHWKDHPERDQAWYDDQVKQLADPRKVAQELDCDFLTSGDTVISGELLKVLTDSVPYPVKNSALGFDHLVIYQRPIVGKKYVAGADVASGGAKDYSTLSIIERESGKIVCDYKGKVPTDHFAKIIKRMATYYNSALVAIENNTGYGVNVIHKVEELGYANLFITVDVSTGKVKKTKGWCTTTKTRPYLITEFVEAISSYHIGISSRRLVDELTTFIWNKDKAEAANSYNDDLIIATAIAWQMRKHVNMADSLHMPMSSQELGSGTHDDPNKIREWLYGATSPVSTGVTIPDANRLIPM